MLSMQETLGSILAVGHIVFMRKGHFDGSSRSEIHAEITAPPGMGKDSLKPFGCGWQDGSEGKGASHQALKT